ncbi:MAG: biotin--[acetyl-CoA-carboxylase] ligase [Desulfomonilaceae bacterium]
MFKPNLIVLEQAESTQEIAKRMAADGAPSGTAIMAINQTNGRGRSGAEWHSPPGKNVALSAIVRLSLDVSCAPLIGLLASISVATLVENLCNPLKAYLKWPNDVLIQNRKIAGILPEARIVENNLEFIILGIGININSSPADFPEHLKDSLTSSLMLTGRAFDIKDVGNRLLETLTRSVTEVENEGVDFVPHVWEERWLHKGCQLTRDNLSGIATGIDSDGSLLLELDDGTIAKVCSGPPLSAGPIPKRWKN